MSNLIMFQLRINWGMSPKESLMGRTHKSDFFLIDLRKGSELWSIRPTSIKFDYFSIQNQFGNGLWSAGLNFYNKTIRKQIISLDILHCSWTIIWKPIISLDVLHLLWKPLLRSNKIIDIIIINHNKQIISLDLLHIS